MTLLNPYFRNQEPLKMVLAKNCQYLAGMFTITEYQIIVLLLLLDVEQYLAIIISVIK